MSRSEVLSPEGLRGDGRRPGEIRRLRCQLSAEPKADGSAYLEQGNTKVLVTVCGPHEVSSQRKAQHDRAVLHCTYSSLPFAGGVHKSHPSRTADSELASSVRSVFDPVVQTQLYPRTQIDVSITLLQADGGVRAACINATTLALIDAGIAMVDQQASRVGRAGPHSHSCHPAAAMAAQPGGLGPECSPAGTCGRRATAPGRTDLRWAGPRATCHRAPRLPRRRTLCARARRAPSRARCCST